MDQKYKDKMEEIKQEHKRKVHSASDDRGIIVVNTGDGKGKSTAAFGTAFRAIGQGFNVAIIQFIKGIFTAWIIFIFTYLLSISNIQFLF